MEDSRMDAAPSTPFRAPSTQFRAPRTLFRAPRAPRTPRTPFPAPRTPSTSFPAPSTSFPMYGAEQRTEWEQPSERAYPLLLLTPVPEPRAPRASWPGAVHVVVTGIAVLVITAELGRRAGAQARLTTLCSAAGFAVVVVPGLVIPGLVSTAPRPRPRPLFAAAPH